MQYTPQQSDKSKSKEKFKSGSAQKKVTVPVKPTVQSSISNVSNEIKDWLMCTGDLVETLATAYATQLSRRGVHSIALLADRLKLMPNYLETFEMEELDKAMIVDELVTKARIHSPLKQATQNMLLHNETLGRHHPKEINISLLHCEALSKSESVEIDVAILGAGSFAEVHRGYYDGNPVAIKVMKEKNVHLPQMEDDFLREGQAMSLAEGGPNIIHFYGIQSTIQPRYIVMELGICTLWDLVFQSNCKDIITNRLGCPSGIMTLPCKLGLLHDCILGLQHLHSVKVLHRDIKPDNMMLCQDNKMKIIDFGLAQITQPGYFHPVYRPDACGSPCYLSPELFDSPPRYSEASDVYSFAIMMNEVLTGKSPVAEGLYPFSLQLQLKAGLRPKLYEEKESGYEVPVEPLDKVSSSTASSSTASVLPVFPPVIHLATDDISEVNAPTEMTKNDSVLREGNIINIPEGSNNPNNNMMDEISCLPVNNDSDTMITIVSTEVELEAKTTQPPPLNPPIDSDLYPPKIPMDLVASLSPSSLSSSLSPTLPLLPLPDKETVDRLRHAIKKSWHTDTIMRPSAKTLSSILSKLIDKMGGDPRP